MKGTNRTDASWRHRALRQQPREAARGVLQVLGNHEEEYSDMKDEECTLAAVT